MIRVQVGPLNDDGSIRSDAGRIVELPNGTLVGGMAPIGIRWAGRVHAGRIVPEKGCPANEFLVTHAHVGGESIPVNRIRERA